MTVFYDKNVKGYKYHFQYKKKDYKSKAFKTKREAVAAEKAFRRQLKGTAMTLEQLIQARLDDYELRDQLSTRAKVEQMYRCRVKPYMKNKDVDSYTIEDINDLVIRLKRKAPLSTADFEPREQSNYSVNYVVKRLGSVFSWGIKNGLCTVNPCVNFQPLKYTPREKVFWTEEQFNTVIASLKPDQYKLKARLELFFWTGMRRSEGRALQWKDFDEARGTVTIRNHIVEDGGHRTVPGRKNGDVMVVPLDDETVEMLVQTKEQDLNFDGFNEDWYILGYKKPFTLSAFAEQLDSLAKHTGVPRITPHGMRHSHVSWLYSNTNLTIQETADRIGDKVQTVENVYAHLYKDNSRKVVGEINRNKKKKL